jgi:hypothetical protein
VTFNWSMGPPEVEKSLGFEDAPNAHQAAYKEVGEWRTLAGKDKFFAVERRGGYPWADGFFNRNDTAPLPLILSGDKPMDPITLHISDAPATNSSLTLRCILFQAEEADRFEIHLNGIALPVTTRDPEWKDAQIFSPKPQPNSGGTGDYKINPAQRLLRLDGAAPPEAWHQGMNHVEIKIPSRGSSAVKSAVQLEKLEAHLRYH